VLLILGVPERTAKGAIESDLVPQGRGEIDRYRDIENGDPPLKAICVVGRGCRLEEFREQGSPAPRYEFEEVVGYLSDVMKTYGRIALTRGFPPYSGTSLMSMKSRKLAFC
jgi:hypothetical protein